MSTTRLFLILLALLAALGALWLSCPGGYLTSRAVFEEFVVQLDTDGDRRISLEEWKGRAGDPQQHRAFDANGDGHLSGEEVETMFRALPPAWRPD